MNDAPDSSTGVLRELLRLSVPASVSMLSRTVTMFIDGVMVSCIGPAALGAQGVGMLVAFVPESFTIGALGVVNTFVSQNLGAGRLRRCGQYTWAGLAMAMLFAALIMPLAAAAGWVFSLIGHEPHVQAMEAMYFRYMILCVPVTISIRVLEAFFYGIHRPKIVFAAAVVANAFNIFGNWLLIFGTWGFPRLGLEGAAIATVCCFGLQLTILALAFLFTRDHRRFGTHRPRAIHLRQCGDILRIGWPAGVSILIDIFTWSIFTTYLVGQFGTKHLAAANAAMRYMHVSFMPAIGVSIAATAIVGKYIGEGRAELARSRAHTALRVAMVYMGLCALAFLIFRHQMIALFVTLSPQAAEQATEAADIVRIGGRIMICAAIFQVFDAMGIVFSGALRGAGDTLWPMVMAASLAVVMLTGGGYLMSTYWPELTSLGPYIAATAYIVVYGVVMAWRFESGAWRRIRLLEPRPPVPAAMAPEVQGTPVAPGEIHTS